MFHAKFHIAGFILQPPFLEEAKIWLYMAKTWSSQCSQNWFLLNLDQCAQGCSMQNFTLLGVSLSPLSQKWPKYGHLRPFRAKTWSSHGPSNWFFLNLNQCAQVCSMPNFTILGVSHCPFFLEMAKIWPFIAKTWSSHGPQNLFFLNLNQCVHGCSMPNFTLLGVSCSPLSQIQPKYGPLWPKQGSHMVLNIGSF